ncbi:MAG TPA: VTT domain-containing protein [Candidatus Paceibacterota bacterium]
MFDLVALIKTAGYLGLFGIVFAESGLLIGFFLPGDSLLFTAGFLASQGYLNIWILAVLTFLGAILGDNFGYMMGKKFGPRVFRKEDSFLFNRDHMERARIFYEKYGGKTIVLARFLPVIRTFVPILAGVGNMKYKNFVFFNILGGFLWAVGMTWLGYFLGNTIPNVDQYIVPIVIAIIILSSLPTITHFLVHLIRNKKNG